MKKILISLLFALTTATVFGQTNTIAKGIVSMNVDSAIFKSVFHNLLVTYDSSDVGGLYWNRESGKWRIFYDSAWHDMVGGGGGSTGTPGNPTRSVQFNSAGTFRGSPRFLYDSAVFQNTHTLNLKDSLNHAVANINTRTFPNTGGFGWGQLNLFIKNGGGVNTNTFTANPTGFITADNNGTGFAISGNTTQNFSLVNYDTINIGNSTDEFVKIEGDALTVTINGDSGGSGDVLTSNGAGGTAWSPASGGSPGGPGVPAAIQYNDGGTFGGETAWTYSKTTNTAKLKHVTLPEYQTSLTGSAVAIQDTIAGDGISMSKNVLGGYIINTTAPLEITTTYNAEINADTITLNANIVYGVTETWPSACSDEYTPLAAASTSVPVVTFYMPYHFTVTRVFASLTTAGTGASVVTCDIHENGTTIMATTKILFTASQTLSANGTVTDGSLAADSKIELFLDVRDTNNVATGLKIYIVGYQSK